MAAQTFSPFLDDGSVDIGPEPRRRWLRPRRADLPAGWKLGVKEH